VEIELKSEVTLSPTVKMEGVRKRAKGGKKEAKGRERGRGRTDELHDQRSGKVHSAIDEPSVSDGSGDERDEPHRCITEKEVSERKEERRRSKGEKGEGYARSDLNLACSIGNVDKSFRSRSRSTSSSSADIPSCCLFRST
jgi:hypothetical protein